MKIRLYPPDGTLPAGGPDHHVESNGERLVIQNLIRPDSVVFDVGACVGGWTQEVLNHIGGQKLVIHLFEPVPATYRTLVEQFFSSQTDCELVFNHAAVARQGGTQMFYHYESAKMLSTLHRRLQAEKAYGIPAPVAFPVRTLTLQDYCRHMQVGRIDFLKIDTEGGEFDVLRGAEPLLAEGRISCIQFEYGGTYLDARTTLQEVYAFLQRYGYDVYKIVPDGLLMLPQFVPAYEDYQYSNFLAVRPEISAALRGNAGMR
ncbi:FkbM family methyltransferase [Brevibacillus sp. GCM10020057]|uniref:FkbM family methyltransferase n=1 Tax=Brevibacillus sp. GCM10020057 TaxID=3317327 RepID=UPI003639F450